MQNAASGAPRYVSRPTVKSLWQEYRLYDDRLELESHILGTIRVPLEDITAISERPPCVICDVARKDYALKDLLRGVKLDLADLLPHVNIEKESGFWRQVRLTPEDNVEFIREVEAARALHARGK